MRLSCCLVHFDLAHSTEVVHTVQAAEAQLDGCHSADVSLAQVNRMDGTGAVLLARLLDRLAAKGCRSDIAGDDNPETSRLLALYRRRRTDYPSPPPRTKNPFARLGAIAAQCLPKPTTRSISLDAVPSPYRKLSLSQLPSIGARYRG